MLYLGIDQHRKQLTVNLRNEQGDMLVKRQVSTEWPRVRSFLDEVREMSVPEGGFVAILEVCGFNGQGKGVTKERVSGTVFLPGI
jgi:transposase